MDDSQRGRRPSRVPSASRAPPLAKILDCGEGLALAEAGYVFIALWRESVTRALFEKQRLGLSYLARRYPGEVSFLCVIEATSKPPEDEIRKASAEMIASLSGNLRCVALVIEGSGFRAAVTRGVLIGMSLLLPNRHVEVSYFSDVVGAVAWMSVRTPINSDEALILAVDRLRSLLIPTKGGV